MSRDPISVVVVDDHPLFRRGVVELLNDSEEMTVIAEYDDPLTLMDDLESLDPDLLLLDLQMPDMSGLDVLKQLRSNKDDLKIIILTACADQDKIVEALRYGANGYLEKDTPSDDILRHLVSVVNGHTALNPSAVNTLASYVREKQVEDTKQNHEVLAKLTDRERETLFFIARGLNNKLIARELGISDGTVKIYVKHLLRKLGLHSRLEISVWTHQNLSEELLRDGEVK